MEFSNDGNSIYHRTVAVYVRHPDGELIRCLGKHCQCVTASWPSIRSAVMVASSNPLRCSETHKLSRLQMNNTELGFGNVDIYEMQKYDQNQITGLIIKSITSGDSTDGVSDFDEFFLTLVLTNMHLNTPLPLKEWSIKDDSTVQRIVDLFDKQLRYKPPNDLWDSKGREYFASKVRFFTSRNRRLETCLPAFPCKSSNPEKVAGILPDKGEEMALRRLHGFVQQVEEIYEPGALVWIISDGHVFSDCIGVDDQTVDNYGAKLKELNQAIALSMKGSTDRIYFRSLVDMFDLETYGTSVHENAGRLNMLTLKHHIATALKDDAELCRRILVTGCQPNETSLRARIDSQDPSILALYRGFSRFMLEDLDLHPLAKSLSRSQRKKLATKVSFEMILRNQAYSNLVELMFPDHLRFSIHAHNNSGPKFGIRLFDTATARATESLHATDDEVSAHDLLHIPTPWHNCVARCEGSPISHIIKSKAVKEALSTQKYAGSWVGDNLLEGQGGFFSLQKLAFMETPKDEVELLAVNQDIAQPAIPVSGIEMGGKTAMSMAFSIPLAIYNLSINYLKLGVARWIKLGIMRGMLMGKTDADSSRKRDDHVCF
ncbi:hypothetical protein PRK78_000309 [Emydomyces testavorans]|uniref:Spore wall maturation protein DIT1 n=1 Tax=Emydomyces testavorans TaxID=2070801 RepID=A0AAF0IFG5_9EURO|nr:hypothetical protein PRK78_000309 [Emydomyces testavorans]